MSIHTVDRVFCILRYPTLFANIQYSVNKATSDDIISHTICFSDVPLSRVAFVATKNIFGDGFET